MTERQSVIVDYLQRYPDVSKLRLAKMLHAERADIFETVERARTMIRKATGCHGSARRKNALVKDTPREGANVYAMPKSKAKPWEVYEINHKRVAILGDIHFPKHDEAALSAAVEHCKEWGVDAVLLNGDIADAEEFGSWAKSPKAIDTQNALQIVREGLLWLLDQFPTQEIYYKFGNHEERLDRYCWSKAPELVGVPHITWQGLLTIGDDLLPIQEMQRIKFIGEQRPIRIGKLTVFHGHELPKGLVNSVNPARGAFLRVLDTVVVNHHHRSSSHVEYNWQHEAINCWSIGCLCDLNPEYARINKWNHGHAIVEADKGGSFSVHNFKQLQNYEVVTA